jgi:hypothetical protein
MKRNVTIVTCALLFLVGGAVLYAESTSTLTIEPSSMKDGETKTFTDNGRTITIKREGNTTLVQIADADKTEKLTITREGGRLRIGRVDSDGAHSFAFGPDRRRIIIDGMPLGDFENLPRFREQLPKKDAQNWFVCPKDHTMLKVPEGKEEQTFRCPVDGTVMEKRKGRGFTLFFDDDLFESNLL